jgi:precorrin-4/cobalt-precorrin-4 C11-methyltransferase
MATVTEKENLIRTTLYIISPALGEVGQAQWQSQDSRDSDQDKEIARSRLYHPEHTHLFRPSRSLP